MDATLARERLARMVAASAEPTLSSAELEDLLLLAARPDVAGRWPSVPWAGGRRYHLNDLVVPLSRNGRVYRVTVAGVAAGTQPAWPLASGATVVDGSVTWQEAGPDLWVNTYDLNAAAAEGWRLKAAKAAELFDFSADGASFSRRQLYEHCLSQAEHYERRGGSHGVGTINIGQGVRHSDVIKNLNAGVA